MADLPPSGKGVVIRCSWCKMEQRLDLGHTYRHAVDAELFLHLMTGGWSGRTPPDFAFRPTSTDDPVNEILEAEELPQLGMSTCCRKQLEGEIFGYGSEVQHAVRHVEQGSEQAHPEHDLADLPGQGLRSGDPHDQAEEAHGDGDEDG